MTGRNLFRMALQGLVWLAMASAVRGQSASDFSGDTLPPRPSGHVQDHAGLYARDPQALRRIDARLLELETQDHFRIYVVIESVVLGSNPVELASRLEQSWLPQGDGFVIVYEVDSRAFGIGRPYDVSLTNNAGSGAQIPSYAASDTIERVRKQLESEQRAQPMESPALLDRLTVLLASECSHYLELSREAEKSSHQTKLAVILGAIILALAAIGFLVVHFTRRKAEKRNRSYRFPPVPDEQRLGAPFGAKVSARRFAGSEPPRA